MENSVPAGQKIPTLHHPDGIEPDRIFFHETQVRDLILEYQRSANPETWQAIVMACLPLIESLIRHHNFQLYEDKDALKNECIIKLFKAIRHYNPDRGRAFSVLSVAFTRFLISYVQNGPDPHQTNEPVEDEILEQYESAGQTRAELPAELKTKIQGIRTRFKTPSKSALEKMRKSREFLNGLSNEKAAFSAGLLSANTEHQLLSAVLEEHHVEEPLYTP